MSTEKSTDYSIPAALIGALASGYYGHSIAGSGDPFDSDRHKRNRALTYAVLGAGAGYGAGKIAPHLSSRFQGDRRRAVMGALGAGAGALLADHYVDNPDDKMRGAKILAAGIIGGGLGYKGTEMYAEPLRDKIKDDIKNAVVTERPDLIHAPIGAETAGHVAGTATGATVGAFGGTMAAMLAGAIAGSKAGVAGGPFAWLTVPAGALIGAGIGGTYGYLKGGDVGKAVGKSLYPHVIPSEVNKNLGSTLFKALQDAGWEYSTDVSK
jgi:hypothetical protein